MNFQEENSLYLDDCVEDGYPEFDDAAVGDQDVECGAETANVETDWDDDDGDYDYDDCDYDEGDDGFAEHVRD